MKRFIGNTISAVLVCVLLVTSASAVIVHETFFVRTGFFDFSERTSVFLDPAADILIAYVGDPPLGWQVIGRNGARVLSLPGVSFESVAEAPGNVSAYETSAEAVNGRTYVILTQESHYAKMVIHDREATVIEYAYQPDGSRQLVDPTPTHQSTWGRIKGLYDTGSSE